MKLMRLLDKIEGQHLDLGSTENPAVNLDFVNPTAETSRFFFHRAAKGKIIVS
jgi:hypothetical protein